MKRLLLVFALLSLVAFAGDFSGTWVGKSDITVDGEQHGGPAKMFLKQDGAKVTGTAGHEDEEQVAIENAVVDGDTLSFDVKPSDDAPLVHIVLKMDGDSLSGTVKSVGEGPAVEGKLELKREK
jgi:hypothetical protein